MHYAAGYGCKAVALWRRAVLLALLGLGWLTLTLLARTRHNPRQRNKHNTPSGRLKACVMQ